MASTTTYIIGGLSLLAIGTLVVVTSDSRRYRANPTKTALKRIEQTPPGIDDGMPHGFPLSPIPDYVIVAQPGYRQKAANAPLVRVPLASLYATQLDVERGGTAFHVLHPDAVPPGLRKASGVHADKPIVVRFRGMLHIVNGHHRLAAAKLRGKTHARVRFVDLDDAPMQVAA